MISMVEREFREEQIRVEEFPPFIRIALKGSARKELFSRTMKKLKTIKKEYEKSEGVFDALYGKKKSKILRLLSESPQTARKLIERSGLSPSVVYHFLSFLKKRQRVTEKGHIYYLEDDSTSLFLDEIVTIEEDPSLRRRYGVSVKELELAYFLWNTYTEVEPGGGRYSKDCPNVYTLADAVHRWRTGRTAIPVWALIQLEEVSHSDMLHKEGSIIQYHLPPSIPVKPYYNDKYKLPIEVDNDMDKVVIQLLQKMSKSRIYIFPKRRRWLFEKLHHSFGEFDDTTFRIPVAITEILKSYYGTKTLARSSAHIPPRIRDRWLKLDPLFRIVEESSLLLHIISLASRSNGGFEITSRSNLLLQEVTTFISGIGLGELSVHRKHQRPHFRVYLSEGKINVLRRYAHLFQNHPDLLLWSRIPLNTIAEKIVLTNGDFESVKHICHEELARFVESILRSLERKKVYERVDYLQYEEEITGYFWKKRLIPSPRRMEELLEMYMAEETMLYV